MDIDKYSAMVSAGTLTPSYVDGDTCGITTKSFSLDPITGAVTEGSPIYTTIKISDLQAQLTTAEQTVTDLETVISALQALTAPVAPTV